MKKPSQQARGYWIGFLHSVHPYEKKQVVIILFIHVNFKWAEKYHRIPLVFLIAIGFPHVAGKKINTEVFHEFLKIKPPTIFHILQFHIRRTNSHSTITSALPRTNHIRKYEKNITWTTRYHKRNPYSHTTKTTWNHDVDSIMEQERNRFWGREFIRRHRVSCFMFDRGCDMKFVSFRVESEGTMCLGGLYTTAYSYKF